MTDQESMYKEMAARYETSKGYLEFGKWLTEIFPAKAEWIGVDLNKGGSLRVLDYAAGPGVVSQAIGPYAKQVVAVDSSTTMMEAFEKKFKDQQDKFSWSVGDLVGPEDDPKFDGEEFHNFDLITVSLAFHHFDDPARAARKLAKRLKEGGILLLFEFKPGKGRLEHSHGHHHGHHHHGAEQSHSHDHAAHGGHTHSHEHGHARPAEPSGLSDDPNFVKEDERGFAMDAIVKLLQGPHLKDIETYDAKASFIWNSEDGKMPDVMEFDFVREKDIPDGETPAMKKDLILARATKA